MISLEEVRQQAAEAQQKALLAKLQYEFAKAFPELNCDANWDLLVKAHQGKPITLDSLITLIQHPDVKAQLALKSPQRVFDDDQKQRQKDKADLEAAKAKEQAAEDKEREKLIPAILSLLKVSDRMKEGERRKYLLKDAKGNWIVPIEQLRTRLQNLKDVSVWRGASTEQLKQHLQSQHAKQTTEFPELPKGISAMQIRCMWNAEQLRNAIKRYGSAQITKRLQEVEE